MIDVLTWVSLITGGLLILLMLLSLLGGLDMDIDIGDADVDTDAGSGIGLLKGGLTFLSVCTWTMKMVLAGGQHPGIAIGIGVVAGIAAFALLNWLFRLLLKNEENVNWSINDALFQDGKVYLRIPEKGNGIVHVLINGVQRELPARTEDGLELPTGAQVRVMEVEGDTLIVAER